MCWSSEASITTWIFAMIMALITKAKADPRAWLFFFTFSQMQLAEFFIWNDLNSKLASLFGLFIILMEPVASINLIKNSGVRNKLWLLYALVVLFAFLTTKINLSNKVGKNGHLVWSWWDSFSNIFKYFWTVSFLLPILYAGYYGFFTLAVSLMLLSMYFYNAYGTLATMWCWISNFAWFFLLISIL